MKVQKIFKVTGYATDFYELTIHFDNDIQENGSNRIKNLRIIARDVEEYLGKAINTHLKLKEYDYLSYYVQSFQNNISDGYYQFDYHSQIIEINIGKRIYDETPGNKMYTVKKELSIEDLKKVFNDVYEYIIQKYDS